MSNEITVEELAAATDAVKKTVQNDKDKFRLEVNGEWVEYAIVTKVASDDFTQLNAMAIAPVVDGTPDYDNVAVVYAGTNTPIVDTGKSGFGTAIDPVLGLLSWEYRAASQYLEETQQTVAERGGRITNVSGFSQSGGYMMKLAAEYGRVYGFRTVSFDDWGGNQSGTLTRGELNWLRQNPGQLIRYQYDSAAAISGRDNTFGTVVEISRTTHNGSHSKYFTGDALNMSALIKDGLFGPGMTEAQVREAAKNWMKHNPGGSDVAGKAPKNYWIDKKLDEYLDKYGSFGAGKFSLSGGTGAVSLSTDIAVTGPALMSTAVESLGQVKLLNDSIPEKIELAYSVLLDACSSQFMGLVDRYDLEEEAHSRGILPANLMDLAAIEEVSQKIDDEINDLTLLSAAVTNVAAKRKAEDRAEANKFGF